MGDERARAAGLKVLLAGEIVALVILMLVVHYGGIPFRLSDQEGAWCIEHGGLPSGTTIGAVRVDHTLWPLGITCSYGTTSIAYPDWTVTAVDYGLVALVLGGAIVTVVLLTRDQRRVAGRAA